MHFEQRGKQLVKKVVQMMLAAPYCVEDLVQSGEGQTGFLKWKVYGGVQDVFSPIRRMVNRAFWEEQVVGNVNVIPNWDPTITEDSRISSRSENSNWKRNSLL